MPAGFPAGGFSAVHTVDFHIIVNGFAVVLLLRLNSVYRLTGVLVGKLKNAGIIKVRSVFFGGEKVTAQKTVVLLIGRVFISVGRRESL